MYSLLPESIAGEPDWKTRGVGNSNADPHLLNTSSIDLTGVVEFVNLPNLSQVRRAEKFIRAAEGGFVEKLITLAKKGDLHARRQAISTLQHPDKGVIYKLFEEIAPRYTERPGGYTRILKLGPRSSDATEMVYLELV
jgi:ribosomal protein L17